VQASVRLSRSLEARAGVLAVLVLTVLTGGAASAVALEQSVLGVAPSEAAAVATAAQVQPRVLVESDRLVVAAWEVPATAVEVVIEQPAPAPADPPATPVSAASPQQAAPAPSVPADPLCTGAGWQQRRGQAALDALRRPSDAAAFSLSFEPARAGVIGLATVHEGRMQVFVRPCGQLSASLLRHVVAHELGHLLDGARLTEAQRVEWMQVRGIAPGTPWYGCNGCVDFATPAGDFAEVYAQWQTGAGSNRSELAGSPSAGELQDLAARFFS
jgi:hypothetical protein